MRLYELSQRYQKVLDLIEGADEDFNEEQWSILIGIEDSFREKVEGVAKFAKSLEADIEAIKAERQRLGDRQGMLTRKVEWLKAYLAHALRSTGTDRVKGQLLTVALRTAPVSCEVVDVEAVPAGYKREVVEVKVDRNAINAHFKTTGEVVPGVQMVTDKQYVQIR